jgi:hypothetical protein
MYNSDSDRRYIITLQPQEITETICLRQQLIKPLHVKFWYGGIVLCKCLQIFVQRFYERKLTVIAMVQNF